jgi:hypothetical protein
VDEDDASATNASAAGDRRTTTTQHDVVDGAIATRATTPAVLSGREGGGGRRLADVMLPGKESDNQHVVGGGVWQGVGVGGARRPSRPPSETTSLALAEALRRRSSQGWTFGRAAAAMAGAAMLSRRRL